MVLFTGTPCQAAGLYSFLGNIKKDNLYVLDFICHGVPSPRVFSDYIDYLERKHEEKIVSFRFRMKDRLWNPTGLQLGTGIRTDSGLLVRHYPGFMDPFMNGFLDDTYLRLSCYDCRFKTLPKYYADITIADFWGVNHYYPNLYDGKGTSLVLINNKHGEELFDIVKTGFYFREVDFNKATRRNKSLIHPAVQSTRRSKFFYEYGKMSFERIKKKYMNPFVWGVHKFSSIIWRIIEKLVRIVVSPLIKAMNLPWDETKWKSVFQFVKFAMIGATNVLVSYSVNVCTLLILKYVFPGFKYDYVVANTTAFMLSVLWSYHWNSLKVFDVNLSRRNRLLALLKTYTSYAFSGIVLNNLLSTFWIRVVGISKYVSPLLNVPITMPINFFILKRWAFRKNEVHS